MYRYLWLTILLLFMLFKPGMEAGNSTEHEQKEMLEARLSDAVYLRDEIKKHVDEVEKVKVAYWAAYAENEFSPKHVEEKLEEKGVSKLEKESWPTRGYLAGKHHDVEVTAAWWKGSKHSRRLSLSFEGENLEEVKETARDILYSKENVAKQDITVEVHGRMDGYTQEDLKIEAAGERSPVLSNDTLKVEKTSYRNGLNLLFYDPCLSHGGIRLKGNKANLNLVFHGDSKGKITRISLGTPFLAE